MPFDPTKSPFAVGSAHIEGRGALAACVAIPARDEEERLPSCLEALVDQSTTERYAVVILANNCTDRTVRIARAFARNAPMPIVVEEVRLEGDQANAGCARRLAMDAASALLGPDGALMTTDADSRVNRSWIATNLAGLRAGADVVCGLVSPDITEPTAFPAWVYTQGALEYLAQKMSAELESLLDPQAHDPWPRHLIESGASLAVRAGVYARVGGAPAVARGEDRAFVDRVRRAGGKVRHALEPRVATSCRLDGRASGGWADDLLRRARDPKAPCHEVLEPTDDLVRRAGLRGALREMWPLIAPAEWAERLGVDFGLLEDLLGCGAGFEDAWAQIAARSPLLVRRRIPSRDLPAEAHKLKKALSRARADADDRPRSRLDQRAGDFAERLWRGLGGEASVAYDAKPRKRRTFASHTKP
jgi:GT2 family glycosyltransferase